MFFSDYNLRGGAGTVYSTDHFDRDVAKIDGGSSSPGYFTAAPTDGGSSVGESTIAHRVAPAAGGGTHLAPSTSVLAVLGGGNPTDLRSEEEGEIEIYYVSDDDEWEKNRNTWKYVFDIYQVDTTFYIYEEEIPGYTSDTTWRNPVIVQYHASDGSLTSDDPRLKTRTDDQGNIIGYYVQITNTRVTSSGRNLTVKKIVSGSGATEEDYNREFHFRVTLTANDPVYGMYGMMEFENSVAEFTLKDGQSISAVGLPSITSYLVEELDANQDGFVTTSTGETGTLTATNVTRTAIFTNTREGAPPPPPPPATGTLTVTKTLAAAEGATLTDADRNKQFLITIDFCSGVEDGVYGDLIVKNGKASVYLRGGESATLSGLPIGAGYTVTETAYNGFVTTYEGNVGTVAAGSQTATVTNTKQKIETNGFTLTKKVVGKQAATAFEFHVELFGLDPLGTYSYTAPGGEITFTATNAGKASLTIQLNDGESAVFAGLPVGSTYRVTESQSGYVPSYTVVNAAAAGSVARASDEKLSAHNALSTATETVDKDEEITITFTNTSPKFPVDIAKVIIDEEGGYEFLAGAKLQVLRGDEIVEEWISGSSAHPIYLTEGEYVLHEVEPPAGYTYAEDIPFSIDGDGVMTVNGESAEMPLYMIDLPTEIKIGKQNGLGNQLPGASLQILDADGNPVCAWISTGAVKTFTGELSVLTPYTLHEVKAPIGYALAADIGFIIDTDGKVYVGATLNADGTAFEGGTLAEDNLIVMNDYKSVTMPRTGSISASIIICMGYALVIIGAALMIKRRRKEQGEA